MHVYAFCPSCYGIFRSRLFQSGTTVIDSIEPCIFCPGHAMVQSSLRSLKSLIINVLRSDEMASADLSEISQILRRLAAHEITPETAAEEIDLVAPGLGTRILKLIRDNGHVVIPLLISAVALYAALQANEISKDANDISRRALDHAIEQAAEQAVSREHAPSQ